MKIMIIMPIFYVLVTNQYPYMRCNMCYYNNYIIFCTFIEEDLPLASVVPNFSKDVLQVIFSLIIDTLGWIYRYVLLDK